MCFLNYLYYFSFKKKNHICLKRLNKCIRDSIVASISACHAEDPGSIPGLGDYHNNDFFLYILFFNKKYIVLP